MELPTSNRKKVIDIWVTESFFATRPVSQMSITFFLLEVGCSMITLFKALIWLYNTYYRLQKKVIDIWMTGLVAKNDPFSIFGRSYLGNRSTYISENFHRIYFRHYLQECQISSKSEGGLANLAKNWLIWHGMTLTCMSGTMMQTMCQHFCGDPVTQLYGQ